MKSYAQASQDTWVHSLIGDSGFFVDIGAYDGIEHSNTYALEQLGWSGICIEPESGAYAKLRDNRPGFVAKMAVSDHFGHVDVNPGGFSSPCIPLADLLALFRAPDVIDYLSIDVEGHELEVLDGMDFDRWHVRLATIEHNLYLRGPDHRDAIRERMIGLGFVLAGADVVAPEYGPYEDWWIHQADL